MSHRLLTVGAFAAAVMTAHPRIAQLPRAVGEKHPDETDGPTVQRYFEMGSLCAEAQRLSLQSTN